MTTDEIIAQLNQLQYDVTPTRGKSVRVTDRLNPLWSVEGHISHLGPVLLFCQDLRSLYKRVRAA